MYPGEVKLQLFKRLGADWRDLAVLFEIPSHKADIFSNADYPAEKVWQWAEDHGRLSELPDLLEILDRRDLAELLRSSARPARPVADTDCGQEMDDLQITALIDRNEPFDKILTQAKEHRRSVFIIAGQDQEWPEALAVKLSRDERGIFSEPTYLPDRPHSTDDPVDWLFQRLAQSKATNFLARITDPTNNTTNLKDQVLEALRQHTRSQVIYIKISRVKEWRASHLKECINAWEQDITPHTPFRHFLLFIVEEVLSPQYSHEKSRARRLFWLFSKTRSSRSFLDYYRDELARHDLQDRWIAIGESPCFEHVHAWIDDVLYNRLNDSQKKDLRHQAWKLFQQSPVLPHSELANCLFKLLQP